MNDVVLQPSGRWWLRLIIVLALSALALLARAEWYKKAVFCAGMAAWLGSFPQARFAGDRFERAMFLLFIPARVKRWSLDRFISIETGTEVPVLDNSGLDRVFWFWWWDWWLIWKLCDLIIPWLGGQYKLWLRSASGKRVLAWQGNSDRQFRDNMELLKHRTGLPVERG